VKSGHRYQPTLGTCPNNGVHSTGRCNTT
jgi:hypothetical protein